MVQSNIGLPAMYTHRSNSPRKISETHPFCVPGPCPVFHVKCWRWFGCFDSDEVSRIVCVGWMEFVEGAGCVGKVGGVGT